MGQSPSLPSSLPKLALHCLRVADLSPASGLVEPFFDYLIGVEAEFDPNAALEDTNQANGAIAPGSGSGLSPVELGRILEENEGKRIGLKVYNAKSQRIRGQFWEPEQRVSADRLCSSRCCTTARLAISLAALSLIYTPHAVPSEV